MITYTESGNRMTSVRKNKAQLQPLAEVQFTSEEDSTQLTLKSASLPARKSEMDLSHREVTDTERAFGLQKGPDKFRHKSYQVSKRFEQLCQAFGVQQFRNLYNATVGAIIYAIGKQRFIKTPTRLGLERAIENTMTLEAMHCVGTIGMLMGTVQDFGNGNILQGMLFTGANLLVNVYPIMMQRCNRARMLRILYSREVPEQAT